MGIWPTLSASVLFFVCCLPVGAQAMERLHVALESIAPDTPLQVSIGVQVEQIVSINQKEENFEVVGNLRMEWQDPALAFDPQTQQGSALKVFTREGFTRFVDQEGIFAPAFMMYNQQGRRFTQNAGVLVFSDGQAVYGERFTVKLQAPEFDFVRYPFDTQSFFIHVQATYPLEFMQYVRLEGFSRLGDLLGEEEWIFTNNWTSVSEVVGMIGKPASRLSFGFEGRRHLNYYLLRIFLPLIIIILVSWLTFFLQDFSKRIDIGGANLLIFVAFNFTVSNDLPRLGYLTFMDAIMVTTFVFSGLVVIVNVIFRRLEVSGKEALARRIDYFTLWIYPVTLVILVLLCRQLFLVQEAHL